MVQRLFFVLKNADWSLELRPTADAANGRDVVEDHQLRRERKEHAMTRVFVTGDCEGLGSLRESLDQHQEIELVGASEEIAHATGALAGGHLDAILHGTRESTLPTQEIAAIREQTRTPILVVASGEGVHPARAGARGRGRGTCCSCRS